MASPKVTANPSVDNNLLVQVKEEQFSPPRESPPPLQKQQRHKEGSIQTLMVVKSENMEIPCGQVEFVKSIDELSSLSTAIGNFKLRYDELQKHVDFIENAMNAKFIALMSADAQPQNTGADIVVGEAGAAEQHAQETGETDAEDTMTEPERNCRAMSSRGLRKYVLANISEAEKLREEIPAALKLAQHPAKLVLDCIGRFFLQGRKAYTHESPMIPARMASILILECFLLMGGVVDEEEIEVKGSVKTIAENCAIEWKKRLVAEGGLHKAEEIDARGLLFFISGFGIPRGFKHDDLVDLIRMSNPIEITTILRRSAILVPKIPAIIEGIMKKGMDVEAVDLALTFGLEDKFDPHSILTSFLERAEEAFKWAKIKSQSVNSLKDANQKLSTALKSVIKCLKTHKIDPEVFLHAWPIEEQIIKLKKEMADIISKEPEERAKSKRRKEETASTNRQHHQEKKRPRLTSPVTRVVPSHPHAYHDQRLSNHMGRNDISALVSTYLTQSSYRDGLGHGSFQDNRVSPYTTGTVYVPTGSHLGIHPHRQYGLQSLYGKPQSVEEYSPLPIYSPIGNPTTNLYAYSDSV